MEVMPDDVLWNTGTVLKIPESTRSSLHWKLTARARERWPQVATVQVRFRNPFAYVDAVLTDGDTIRLCRLRYIGYAYTWGFAIWRASHDDYEESGLPNGSPIATPEQALDTACGLYLDDYTAWTDLM